MAHEEKDAYTLRRRRLACENARFEVFLDDVESPGGEVVRDYLVVAPRTRVGDLTTGIAVLPVASGKLGLLRLYRHAVRRYLWEVPRGFIDPGESDRSAALRELEEETGLSCADSDLRPLGLLLPEPGILAAAVRLFAARDCRARRPFKADEFGHKAFRWFEPQEVADLQEAGEMLDPSTLVTYFRYQAGLTGGGG